MRTRKRKVHIRIAVGGITWLLMFNPVGQVFTARRKRTRHVYTVSGESLINFINGQLELPLAKL